MKSLRILIVGQSLLTLFAAQAMASGSPGRSEMASAILKNHIVPGYAALEAGTVQLKAAVETSCSGGQSLDRKPVREAFEGAFDAWMRVQHIRFGPAMTKDRHYRFQYWPDKHGQGSRQMRKLLATPISDMPDADTVAGKSVALQGFPALEQLIFPVNPPPPDERAKRCKLAIAISSNLDSMATQTHTGWKSYQPVEPQEMIAKLVRNLSEQLQVIADLKLKRPLGKSADKPRPRRAESWRSGRSYENIRQNFIGLKSLFNGNAGAPGLRSGMDSDGEGGDAADAIAEHLNYGATQAGQQKQSLSQAVDTQPGRGAVTFLVQHTDATRELVLEYLAPALGVSVGFNAQDGD